MCFIRKAIHHRANFCHDDFADAHIDAGHPIEDANHLHAAQWLGAFSLP